MSPLIAFLLVLVVVVILLSSVWYWAMKKQKASVRLLTAIFGFLDLSLGGFIWYMTRDQTILIIAVGVTISQSVFILALPKIAPEICKKLGIK